MLILDKSFKGTLSRDINDYPQGVVLVIDKPYRWTSADVIRKVKFAAIRHFQKKNLKVGHAGTLDPLATGVLIVCIGNACKNAEKLQASAKEYVAGVCFGATTPSYDLEKEVDRYFPLDGVSEESVRGILPSFIGEQDQIAPLFSAKQVDGVRAYELARKLFRQGKTLDEAAAELLRVGRINISDMELLGYADGTAETTSADGTASAASADASSESAPERSEPSAIFTVSEASVPRSEPSADEAGVTVKATSGASGRINVAQIPQGLPVATIRVACSKGTYIRALARDLGEKLGSGAFLGSLQRSASGSFRVEDALSVEQTIQLLER